jgi:DNA-binding beta-propeller fold protein YncE
MSHYSGCLLSDQIVELSTQDLRVTRRLRLPAGQEGLTNDGPSTVAPAEGACRPSWVVVSPDDRMLYVTCNGRSEVLEVERESFTVTRRFATGAGPYNAALTPDGSRLLVTLRGAGGLAVIDLERGTQQHVPTSRSVTHGVVVSPDGRYAFVSNEAVGGTRGTVDVVEMATTSLVSTVELHSQTGGISFWKAETTGR